MTTVISMDAHRMPSSENRAETHKIRLMVYRMSPEDAA